MAEGAPEPTGTARRGRRQTAGEVVLSDQQGPAVELNDNIDDAGAPGPEDPVYLYEGDVVTGKVVHTVQFDGVDSWFTYGVATRVQPGETEVDTYVRVSEVCNTRSLDLAADAEEHINMLRERVEVDTRERRKNRRIISQQD